MRYSTSSILAALAAPLLVSARPVRTRAASANDALVFQFANVLEQLETEFYAQGIAKFKDADFTAAGFSSSLIASQTLATIQFDEATHTTVIQQTLKDNGAKPLICKFKFGSALDTVTSMAATARVVEYVGVAAYLGGAVLIDDPVFLDAAASILTVEARHQTVLNIMSGTGSAIPSAFDIPMTPQEILGIAGGFIDGPCDLGLKATNPLTVTNKDTVKAGTLLTVSGTNITGTDGLFCNMMVGGAPFSINLPLDKCVVPEGINGPVALWITSDNNPLVNNVVNRATTQQVAGPAILFIDSQPEMLGQLVRSSKTGGGASSTETTTITPDEASKIIAGASSTSGAPSSTKTAAGKDGKDGKASTDGQNGQAAPASTPLPPDFKGKSPDGKTTVDGIKMVPRPQANASASSGASSSGAASSSAAAPSATK
ncbi:ferritin-like domain-containing protein [Mycena belliarum]|uniref:Ferritin-like domain-containing protein n=1 Tax=Mycena belliarum TaxID=1033014 RepID=A0AAD6XRE6_9AGAR|nr:ferritin-like domain-containing protein [Mycena belliae]